MGKNMQRLGDTLSGTMRRTAGAMMPTTLELGVINGNYALITDSIKTPIPKGDYMVNIILASESYDTEETTHTHDGGNHGGHQSGNGSHSHDGGEHVHRLPSVFRALLPGDRVLVAWCGYEPIVIAILVGS